eukprot:4145525-Alexandrium_andersonii.AAC.1
MHHARSSFGLELLHHRGLPAYQRGVVVLRKGVARELVLIVAVPVALPGEHRGCPRALAVYPERHPRKEGMGTVPQYPP